jgi:DeoR/GlpR family transcriptional regulator of sugar metabolism
MLTVERRQFILEILRRDKKVLSSELSNELKVSEDTVRRDLRELAEAGLLQRVHGGALLTSPATASYTGTERKRSDRQSCREVSSSRSSSNIRWGHDDATSRPASTFRFGSNCSNQ